MADGGERLNVVILLTWEWQVVPDGSGDGHTQAPLTATLGYSHGWQTPSTSTAALEQETQRARYCDEDAIWRGRALMDEALFMVSPAGTGSGEAAWRNVGIPDDLHSKIVKACSRRGHSNASSRDSRKKTFFCSFCQALARHPGMHQDSLSHVRVLCQAASAVVLPSTAALSCPLLLSSRSPRRSPRGAHQPHLSRLSDRPRRTRSFPRPPPPATPSTRTPTRCRSARIGQSGRPRRRVRVPKGKTSTQGRGGRWRR